MGLSLITYVEKKEKKKVDCLLVKTCLSFFSVRRFLEKHEGVCVLCSSREGSALALVLAAVFPAGLGNETHLLESRKVVKEDAQCHVGGWRGHLRS